MGTPPVTIYSSAWCGYCMRAKALLDSRGIAYKEIDVDGNRALREEMIARSGRRTVPQVFIGEHHVGGSDDLAAAARSGELDRLLGASARAAAERATEQSLSGDEDSHV
ncbi:MAG: glutaredoxin [Proteobacteria bacterium]|nr:glutaredoxin [Pseudomonadota bacterium]